MKVLFIGGTGLISSEIARHVLAQNVQLYLYNRGNNMSLASEGANYIVGDLKQRQEKLDGMEFDVVVNFIAYKKEDVMLDYEIFKGRVGQYVFISSASAYKKPTFMITESTPLKNPHWQYSRDKIACCEFLNKVYRENNYPITIIRPSHTYGNSKLPVALSFYKSLWTVIDRMQKEKPIIVHGDGTSLWTLTHTKDFAKGFVPILGNHKTIGEAYHITSDEVLDWNTITSIMANALGKKPNIVHKTSEFLEKACPNLNGCLLGDKSHSLVFDNSKIKALNPSFKAEIPFYKGVEMVLQWWFEHKEKQIIDEQYNKIVDSLIDG